MFAVKCFLLCFFAVSEISTEDFQVKDIMLIDVTPLTLGVETDGGVFSEVLPRGSAVPWQVRQKDD